MVQNNSSKKKIGILTYHRSYNYGAFMQCYSLSTRLQRDFPDCTIEVIDILSKEVYRTYHGNLKNNISLILDADSKTKRKRYTKSLLLYIKNKAIGAKMKNANTMHFDQAVQQLSLSDKFIISDDVDELSEYINNRYDIVVVGSDAVWNFQMRPFPNVYFLGDTIKTKKLSYAASSYAQPYKVLPEKKLSYIRNAWRSFDYIGVRDIPTEDFVKFADTNLIPHHNCDPTVFLDMEKLEPYREKVYEKLMKAGFDPHKKSIGIMMESPFVSVIRECLTDEYQLVSVYKSSPYSDINLMDITPFEWAVCFSFFDITITNYFHGNLLSLKNGTPTMAIEKRTPYNNSYNSKIRDVMKRLNMMDHCYYEDEMEPNTLKSKIDELMNTDKNQIFKEIQNEAIHYNSFKTELQNLICK